MKRLGDSIQGALGAVPGELVERQRQRWLATAAELVAPTTPHTRVLRLIRHPAFLTLAAAAAVALGVARMTVPAAPPVARAPSALPPGGLGVAIEVPPGERPRTIQLGANEAIRLDPGSRVEVLEHTPPSTRFRLVRGHLRLALPPGTTRHWSVAAGTYLVTVVGTVFDVDYEPTHERLSVRVERGTVRLGGGMAETAGIVLREGETYTSPVKPTAPPVSSNEPAGPQESGQLTTPPAPSGVQAHPVSWRDLYRARDYRGGLAAAEREGFEHLCETLGPSELANLADLSRLGASPARATQSLQCLRQHHAGTLEASNAAFLLGRQGSSANHAAWLETYLSEQPSGSFSPEAMGRLLVTYRALHRDTEARSLARRYLERYPEGPYAKHARAALAE